eukprot:60970_1
MNGFVSLGSSLNQSNLSASGNCCGYCVPSSLLFINLFCIYHDKCGSISDHGVLHDIEHYPYQSHHLNVCLLVDCAWRVLCLRTFCFCSFFILIFKQIFWSRDFVIDSIHKLWVHQTG